MAQAHKSSATQTKTLSLAVKTYIFQSEKNKP
jgi:hypothetical protein